MSVRLRKVLLPPQLPHVGKLILRLRLLSATFALPVPGGLETTQFVTASELFCSVSRLAIPFQLRLNRDRDGYFPL